jgi:aldose 1-epimerase
MPEPAGTVTVEREDFGVASKSPIYLFWLRSPGGLAVAVSTWGASTVHVCAPDREGLIQEVTLNHPDLDTIMQETSYYGATVGRVASTIAGARYKLGRKEFKLSANINGQHHAHGGFRGFDKQVWHAEVLPATAGAASVRFTYTSIDGEEGYAGTLTASVVYTVTATNDLILEYGATTDKPTPINLTNHTVGLQHGCCCCCCCCCCCGLRAHDLYVLVVRSIGT